MCLDPPPGPIRSTHGLPVRSLAAHFLSLLSTTLYASGEQPGLIDGPLRADWYPPDTPHPM